MRSVLRRVLLRPQGGIDINALSCLHFDAGNATTVFSDSAMFARTWTPTGAVISTTLSRFGGSSGFFDGASYILGDGSADYAFGASDFTIEMWFYVVSTTGNHFLYCGRPAATQGAYPTIFFDGSGLYYFHSSANRITGATPTVGVWQHLAVSRKAGSTRMFVDGIQVGSTYVDATSYLNPANRPSVGMDGFGLGAGFNGYIDEQRISNVGRYDANFVPPARPFSP